MKAQLKLTQSQALLIANKAVKAGGGTIAGAIACIQMGQKEMEKIKASVPFKEAVETALKERENTTTHRTYQDMKFISSTLLKKINWIGDKKIQTLSPEDCKEAIKFAFNTTTQRNKARLIMSGIFSTALKHGWVEYNVVSKVAPF